eukprot:Tbor_TRINITY_DN5077_c0_g1::TRINITY_DN5077_c0_g1_i1::g.14211::m.14211/K06127/COQ5; 2-methoxy-6-polyprenyl-1,4-benzoquinol methylase
MLRRSFTIRNLNRGDEYVKRVFDTVAPQYDMMNDVLSLGVHRLWKTHYVSNVVQPRPGMKFLDVAGGTGDIALRIYDTLKEKTSMAFSGGSGPIGGSEIVVLDINQKMLNEGQARATRTGYRSPDLKWVCASGESIPFPDNYFDSCTIAFGIRNFSNRPKGLREAQRVLKVGGAINVLEFSSVECTALKLPYQLWSDVVMPAAGRALSDEESYQYLVDSIKAFPAQDEFADLMRDAGFGYVKYENLTGGIACIHTGVKTETVRHQPSSTCSPTDVEKLEEVQHEATRNINQDESNTKQ